MKTRWLAENRMKLLLLNPELKALMPELREEGADPMSFETLQAFLRAHSPAGLSMSQYLKKYLSPLVKLYVPKDAQALYYAAADRLAEFQYSVGCGRRSFRSREIGAQIDRALWMLSAWRVFAQCGVSPADYIRDALPEELRDFKRNNEPPCTDNVLAAYLSVGDAAAVEAAKEALTSENNHVRVTVTLVRAIVKADCPELHVLLGKLLLAAREQEGLRQAICENADCGTRAAFLEILRVIEENDLLRFSAVRRAAAAWCGIFSDEATERLSAKVFRTLCIAARSEDDARALTESNDSVELALGLWGLGFVDAELSVRRFTEIVRTGTRNQVLTVSYFAPMLQSGEASQRCFDFVTATYPDDPEFAAAYLPCCLDNVGIFSWELRQSKAPHVTAETWLRTYYVNNDDARACFVRLRAILAAMPKNKLTFSPCVFPWHSVFMTKAMLAERLAFLAYALGDAALIDEMCALLPLLPAMERGVYTRLLLEQPATEAQRRTLLTLAADKSSETHTAALAILGRLRLSEEEFITLEGFLRYKNEDIRMGILDVLAKRADVETSLARLLAAGDDNVRLAGLSLAKTAVEKTPKKADYLRNMVRVSVRDRTCTPQAQVLVDDILGSQTEDLLNTPGYGLYDPANVVRFPKPVRNDALVQDYFSLSYGEIGKYYDSIADFLDEHAALSYRRNSGDTVLLGNGLFPLDISMEKLVYPFPELWREVYESIIGSEKVFWNLYYAALYAEPNGAFEADERKLFGACSDFRREACRYHRHDSPNDFAGGMISTILEIILGEYDLHLPLDVACAVCAYAIDAPHGRWKKRKLPYHITNEDPLTSTSTFDTTLRLLLEQGGTEGYFALQAVDEAYDFIGHAGARHGAFSWSGFHTIIDDLRACTEGLIPEDMVYHAAFERVGIRAALEDLSSLFSETRFYRHKRALRRVGVMHPDGKVDQNDPIPVLGKKIYSRMVDMILEVEVRRGDAETVFSSAIGGIKRIYGLDRLRRILAALGDSPFDRNAYYGFSFATDRKSCLSHLLKVCHPLETDTPEAFGEMVRALGLSERRLAEIAMYVPEWLGLIEKYLGWQGFTSGCYYFMAHMNERFDERREAVIARYTPLSTEELNDGCFDSGWFAEVYAALGEKRFMLLYGAAKYIADGSKHARARKYADAALSRVSRGELEAAICDKRNKDLLMSYGILPLEGKEDLLRRYEFLQAFLKESREFGAQRRASEAKAVDCAIRNLATTAGYLDALRLTLAMETALVRENQAFFDSITEAGYTLRAEVDAEGKASLSVEREGKRLKSVPAAIKKKDTVLAVREFVKKLRDQYSRCTRMFERAMEAREEYTLGELRALLENPVICGILQNLVFICEGKSGLLSEFDAQPETILRVAHPYDLYAEGTWAAWQRRFFDEKRPQPFRQVFRELYLRLPEELDAAQSRMFAGNQLMVAKTLALLRTRGWTVDECGLQKVSYGDGVAAELYALADWFSPADAEPPTLEYVSFHDRRTFEPVSIRDLHPVTYSEIMRDVDLAVSVAHAGAVDPVTSHSTIEMRRVVAEFNVELFGLTNVRCEGSHAFIAGKLGSYTIHLGSGVIHSSGRAVNVLPVHSQSRGKLFLPFVDDDPKTAEIISKIILFAGDTKIKDPYILDQLN